MSLFLLDAPIAVPCGQPLLLRDGRLDLGVPVGLGLADPEEETGSRENGKGIKTRIFLLHAWDGFEKKVLQ